MADRYDKLNHNTYMASIGSMAKRWKDAIYVPPPLNIEDFFTVESPAGIVIADEMGATIHQLTILSKAVRTTSYLETEPLDDDVLDAMQDRLSGDRPNTATSALASIISLNEEVYERLTAMRMVDWKNSANSGSVTVSMPDLARGLSRVNAERLSRAIRALDAIQ